MYIIYLELFAMAFISYEILIFIDLFTNIVHCVLPNKVEWAPLPTMDLITGSPTCKTRSTQKAISYKRVGT